VLLVCKTAKAFLVSINATTKHQTESTYDNNHYSSWVLIWLRQWAAVRAYLSDISTAPHNQWDRSPSKIAACQGTDRISSGLPPTIRDLWPSRVARWALWQSNKQIFMYETDS